MVIYNTVHYDALAISPGPKAAQEEDATEFNPRTRRGKMIMAAAQKLVREQQELCQHCWQQSAQWCLCCVVSAQLWGQSQRVTKPVSEHSSCGTCAAYVLQQCLCAFGAVPPADGNRRPTTQTNPDKTPTLAWVVCLCVSCCVQVALNRRGKEGHHEQQHKEKEQQRQQRKQKKQQQSPEPQQQGPDQQDGAGSKEQPTANGHAAAAAQQAAVGGGGGGSSSVEPLGVQVLGCQSCGARLAGVDAARAHAAATGHVEFAEVD